MNQITIIVAANNYLFSKGLEGLINENPCFEILSNAANESELLARVASLKEPGNTECSAVLAIDLSSIDLKPEALQQIKASSSQINILAFNNMQPKQVVSGFLANNITSYLLLCCDKEEITEAIYKTSRGERFVCGQVLDALINNADTNRPLDANCPLYSVCGGVSISEREAEVIRLIAEGLSNRQIAEKLFLSVHTISTHRKNIMCKLGINNTAGLVMYAVKSQLVGAEA